MTLAAAVDGFLDFEFHVRGIAPTSAKLYGFYLRHFARLSGHNVALSASWRAPEAFLSDLSRRGCGDHARAKAFQILRAFYRWAADHGLCTGNPLASSRPPIIHQTRRHFLTPAEVERLIETARRRGGSHAERDAALLATLYYGGLRVGEAIKLRPEDADLQEGVMTVLGKGGKVAHVPLHPKLIAVLRHWMRVRPQGAARLFPSMPAGKDYFGALDNPRVELLLREVYGPAAGLAGRVTPHVLRRSFATHLRARGVPLEHVRRLLRHSSIETTMLYLREAGISDLRSSLGKL